MFRQLNRAAIFGSCVDVLTTDYEIRQNYSSPVLYFSPLSHPTPMYTRPTIAGGRAGWLDHPTHPYARPRWSAQGTLSVGRWYQISHANQVRRFIYWATRILSIRRPPHPLKYTNIDIDTKTGILAPISTDTNQLTKILYRNSTRNQLKCLLQHVSYPCKWPKLLVIESFYFYFTISVVHMHEFTLLKQKHCKMI